MRRPPPWPVWIGLALLVVTHAVVLAFAAVNRSDVHARLELGPREVDLPPVSPNDEDSGLTLRLEVSETQPWNRGEPGWLGAEKLAELGFDTSVPVEGQEARHHYARMLARPVWLVLELGGPGFERWLAEQESQIEWERDRRGAAADLEWMWKKLERDRETASRLVVVDVGLDREPLVRRYPDPSRYAVVPGTVEPYRIEPQRDGEPESGPPFLTGHVRVLPTSVHVPLTWRRPVLEAAEAAERARQSDAPEPDFEATVAFGRWGEPWLTGFTPPP